MLAVDLKSRGVIFFCSGQNLWLISWGSLNYSKSYPRIHPWQQLSSLETWNLNATLSPKWKKKVISIQLHWGVSDLITKVLTDGIVLCKDELGELKPGKSCKEGELGFCSFESWMTIYAGNKARLSCPDTFMYLCGIGISKQKCWV